MNASKPFTGKLSAARTGLILFSLLVVWLGFVVLPSRKKVPERIAPAESALAIKLHAVGLPENPDFEALPEIFAIWAGNAEWKDNKTKFAYWHPVMKTYSYYFEATRTEGRFRFAEVAESYKPELYMGESLGEDCPIRFYYSYPAADRTLPNISVELPPHDQSPPKVEVTVPKIQAPDPFTSDKSQAKALNAGLPKVASHEDHRFSPDSHLCRCSSLGKTYFERCII